MTLELRGLRQRYGRVTALDDVSIQVRRGEVYGLIGHNGAGKTTAMRIALGLVRPDRGAVWIDGRDAARAPREARACTGGLIEGPGFHGGWDGVANLLWLARLQRLPARHDQVAQVLETVGLGGLRGQPVRGYSHGMRQRLGIAQALLGAPDYVLLDEPTDGLDPEGIAQILDLLVRTARERGAAVLISSHQLHQLSEVCDRVGLLRSGRLLVEQPVTDLLHSEGRYVLCTADDAAAAAALRGDGLRVSAAATGLILELDDRDPAAVARQLVARGHALRAFAPRARTLEEVYLTWASRPPALPGAAADAPARPPAAAGPPRAPRRPIAAVVGCEVERWSRSLGCWSLLALPGVVAAVSVTARKLEADGFARDVGDGALASTTTVTGFEAVALGLRTGLPLLVVVLLGIVSQTIAGELGRGTLRHVLLRPVTRLQLLLGKAFAAAALALAGYAWVAAASFGAATACFPFDDLTEILPNGSRYAYLSAAELWAPVGRALWSPVLPLAAYLGLALLCSAAVRGPVVALALALGSYAGLDAGRALVRAVDREFDPQPACEALLPSAYLPSPFGDTSYLAYYYRFALGESNAVFRFGGTELLVPLAWTAATLVLAALFVRHRRVP